MSGMVDIVLKMTFGLFVKKARSSLSEKLKDGGLNSQQLRSLIISNLQDVETNLVGLARGNLLSSVSFIQEGLRLLDDLLDKPNTPTLPPQGEDDKVEGNSNRASNLEQASSSGSDSPLNVDLALKLVESISRMKINSSDHFASAIESFKNANTRATDAFHNEALGLEDRVLASKLRVQSRVLLSLENPSLARKPCRLYLEELHGLSSVVEMFRNDLEGGRLSFLNKEKRHKLVLSVSAINIVVFKFLKSFTKGPITLYEWPNLKCGSWTYNPLIPDIAICVELQFPNLVVVEDIDKGMSFIDIKPLAVNSNGHLIMGYIDRDDHANVQKITMNGVKTSIACPLSSTHKFFLAIDSNDNIYVLTDDKCSGSRSIAPPQCELICVNSKKNQIEGVLLIGVCPGTTTMAPTPDGFAVVSCNWDLSTHDVAFYKNNKGRIQCTFSFVTKLLGFPLIAITNKYQVVVVERYGYRVRVYEKDGQLIREFELYGGERERCVSIAFNYLTQEVVFVSYVGKWYFLSTYVAETGERRHSTRLSLFGKVVIFDWKREPPCLTAHCNGPMALVSGEYVLLLQ